jgi:hypothetical protein
MTGTSNDIQQALQVCIAAQLAIIGAAPFITQSA